MAQEPQIVELDPEKAPRAIAIMLLVCGLLGVGFMVVNSFMGADPNLVESEWDEGTEPVNQRFDILPNLVRGHQEVGESDEDEDSAAEIKEASAAKKRKATTGPVNPFAPRTATVAPATPGSSTNPPASGTTPGTGGGSTGSSGPAIAPPR